MKVYFAPKTRAVRVVWLLEELGLDYEIETFALGDPKMRSPDYLTVHPMGRVPALEDGGDVIFESGAIVQYVLARHGGGRMVPDVASEDFAPYLQWLHYAEGMIMPPVNTIVVETILLPPERRNQTNVDRATKLLSRMLTAVEQRMEGRAYLAGDFSGADIMCGHACMAAARLGADLTDRPALTNYIDRLQTRPALAKALALGAET